MNAYSQGSGQDLSFYDIIEKRNFFKPKIDDSSLGTGRDSETIKKLSDKYTPESSSLLEFRLTGIIKLKNKFKAIIEKKNGTEGFYVGVGDSLKDFIVNSIEEDKVILEKNDQEYTLRLKKTVSQQELKLEGNFKQIIEKEKTENSDTELQYSPSMIQDLRSGGNWRDKQN